MLTRPCNLQPLTSHFYIVKLGFTGIYTACKDKNTYFCFMEKLSKCKIWDFMVKKKITWSNAGEKWDVKAKPINFMVKHKISWRNACEIPPDLNLQGILQLIMEKNEKCVFNFTSSVHIFFLLLL